MKKGGIYMEAFQELQDEKRRIEFASLLGKTPDFSKLRQIAISFNEQNNTNLNVAGTDKELWKRVQQYFRNLLRDS